MMYLILITLFATCLGQCPAPCPENSHCLLANATCVCDKEYTTVTDFCQYKRKTALVGLVMTCILNPIFPVGRCYTVDCLDDLKHISLKISVVEVFTSGALCFCLAAILAGICVLICHPTPRFKHTVYYALCVYVPLTIAWYVVDIIQFVQNDIVDENGIDLVPL